LFPDETWTVRFGEFGSADASMNVTESGISIRFKFDEQNANVQIRRNCDGDENVISSSDLHEEKHDSSRISIEVGISTIADDPKYRISVRPEIS
jgi:hypothetical protein